MMHVKEAAAYEHWRAVRVEWKRRQVVGRRAVMHLVHRSLVLGYNTWQVGAEVVRRQVSLVRWGQVRMLHVREAVAYNKWNGDMSNRSRRYERGRAAVVHMADRGLALGYNRCKVAIEERRCTAVVMRIILNEAALYYECRGKLVGWRRWVLHANHRKLVCEYERSWNSKLQTVQECIVPQGYNKLKAASQYNKDLMKAVAYHTWQAQVLACSVWRNHVAWQKQMYFGLARVSRSRAALHFSQWREATAQTHHNQMFLQRAMRTLSPLRMTAAFRQWQLHHAQMWHDEMPFSEGRRTMCWVRTAAALRKWRLLWGEHVRAKQVGQGALRRVSMQESLASQPRLHEESVAMQFRAVQYCNYLTQLLSALGELSLLRLWYGVGAWRGAVRQSRHISAQRLNDAAYSVAYLQHQGRVVPGHGSLQREDLVRSRDEAIAVYVHECGVVGFNSMHFPSSPVHSILSGHVSDPCLRKCTMGRNSLQITMAQADGVMKLAMGRSRKPFLKEMFQSPQSMYYD